MAILLQILFNGLIAGSIYALVAVGFSLIYSTGRFMHFAHGAVVALGAYLQYWFFNLIGINFYLSFILTLFSVSLIGYLMHRFVYKPLKDRGSSSAVLLIVSVGLMIVIENFILLIFGASVKSYSFLEIRRGIEIAGALITPLQIFIIAISVALFLLLYFFMKKSKLGRIIRAVSDNPELARISGINAHFVHSASFIIGSAMASLAGVLIALEQNLEPTMGLNLIVKGFTGAVIGGIMSIPGSIAGSFFLGIVENAGIWYLPSGYKDAIAFVILFLFLIFKPKGIFGIKKRDE